MKQLDRKFYGTIRKVKDGSLVLPDQYVVFLAKDNAFAAILPAYVAKQRELGCDERQITSSEQMVARVMAWREAHPEQCKNPDIAEGEKLLTA